MNVQPGAAASSVAGTMRAAAKGGEADNQASEAARQQSTANKPAGQTRESPAVEAGEHTGDRGGDGRQLYDTLEHHERASHASDEQQDEGRSQDERHPPAPPGTHIDFQA